MHIICWKCRKSVEPSESFKIDAKTKKKWLISQCPTERCQANLDIELWDVKRKTDPYPKLDGDYPPPPPTGWRLT